VIAKCLNCNKDYEQETQGAICPHAVGGPNSLPPWPKLQQPFPETWARYEKWCKLKSRHALHGDLWEGFLAGAQAFEEHTQHVAEFLNDMYATMIDPVEQPKLKVAELCELLLATARDQRERFAEAQRGMSDSRIQEKEAQGWIPVEQSAPARGEIVLLFTNERAIESGWLRPDEDEFILERSDPHDEPITFKLRDGRITHWHTMPAPPAQPTPEESK
jgi:hypothetical protein